MTNSDLHEIDEVIEASKLRVFLFGHPIVSVADHREYSAFDHDDDSAPARVRSQPARSLRLRPPPPAVPPPWLLGLSKQFKKDIDGLDRKLQGRLMEVLVELSAFAPPFQAQGDTFKPLKGELHGCWRYRIGDHRLVVQPVEDLCQLNALAFGARGSIYD